MEGTLDKRAFVERLRQAPLEIRDHLVEEILDVAYPPLEDGAHLVDVIGYVPSGITEILFAIERAELGPDKTFVDLGSGLGKVVLLVALLSGARGYGLELDPRLVAHAREAAQSLRLDHAHFIEADIRYAELPPADVYYMYIPFIGASELAARIKPHADRKFLLFSQALDLTQFPWLRPRNEASYWIEMYESA